MAQHAGFAICPAALRRLLPDLMLNWAGSDATGISASA